MKIKLFWILTLVLLFFRLPAQESLEIFKDSNGKYGFKNKSGEIVIPAKYQQANNFREGLARFRLDNKWSFVDKTGKEVIPINYQSVSDFYDGLAMVILDNKWGFIDKNR